MAWPLSPLTTYVASSTPSIKAFDLNSIQDAINKILLSTYSHKGMTIDGTGGAAVAAVNGLLITVANPASTTAFTNTLVGANMPKAWGRITSGGSPTLNAGFNLSTITNGATNAIRITMASAMTSSTTYTVISNVQASGSDSFCSYQVISSTAFDLYLTKHDGTFINLQSSAVLIGFVVYGTQ